MINGACLCGGVTFTLEGALRPVINCHCSQCLKTHGHYAAYTSVAEENVSFISKQTLAWYRSSEFAQRGFCQQCGASLFWSRDDSQYVSVSAGVLSPPTGLKTAAHIFVQSKGDYYDIVDSIPCHEKGMQSKLA